MASISSGGPGKSNGNSNSPNDRELDRKRQESYDELRRREEGDLIVKDYFFVKINIKRIFGRGREKF